MASHDTIGTAICVAFELVAPGYALIAALFPDAEAIDGLERAALRTGVVTRPLRERLSRPSASERVR